MHGAQAASLPVLVASADLLKWLNRFALAISEHPNSCIAWESSFTSNYSLTFGVHPASNVAQTGAHCLITVFLEDFAVFDALYLEADVAAAPVLVQLW